MLWALIKELAKKTQLSDIHIHADRPIAYREHGEMKQLPDHVTKAKTIDSFLEEFLEKDDLEAFKKTKCFQCRFVCLTCWGNCIGLVFYVFVC